MSSHSPLVKFCHAKPDLAGPLAELFCAIVEAGDYALFHPHPLTLMEAERICSYEGKDCYYVGISEGCVVCYGMLRGWDAGYNVPSLGIVVHPAWRGGGLGRSFMGFLHEEAKQRGAKRIRLKVYKQNAAAVNLYSSLGYSFLGSEEGQLIGYKELWEPSLG